MKLWRTVAFTSIALYSIGCAAETLEEKVERMDKEIKELKANPAAPSRAGEPPSKLSLGGYGEVNYNNYRDGSRQDQVDLRRFVLYFGYGFSDDIRLVSELEFEHGFFENGEGHGELAMEQAYLQFKVAQSVNVRAGLMLLPMGLINENHEPTVFYGVERNEVETRIIPTTWRELGLAAQGSVADGLEYNFGIVSSVDSSRHGDASSGFKEYRTKASKSPANDLALFGGVNYRGIPGLLVGAGVFSGNTAQNGNGSNPNAALEGVNARLTVWDVHAKYTVGEAELRGLYAAGTLGDTNAINTAAGLSSGSDKAAPKSFFGWYVEGAYHVLKQGNHDLAPFLRYERYNTQRTVDAGFSRDPKNDEKVVTIGLQYKPHPQVVIKADYQNYIADNKKDRWNLGIGFSF